MAKIAPSKQFVVAVIALIVALTFGQFYQSFEAVLSIQHPRFDEGTSSTTKTNVEKVIEEPKPETPRVAKKSGYRPFRIVQIGAPRTASTFQYHLLQGIVDYKAKQSGELEPSLSFFYHANQTTTQEKIRTTIATNQSFVMKTHLPHAFLKEWHENGTLTVFSSGGFQLNYAEYTQNFQEVNRCPSCEAKNYQSFFGLSDQEIEALELHIKHFSIIRQCCGYQKSKYEIFRLYGCVLPKRSESKGTDENMSQLFDDDVENPHCEQYNLTWVETEFAASPFPYKSDNPRKLWNKPGDCERIDDWMKRQNLGNVGRKFVSCEEEQKAAALQLSKDVKRRGGKRSDPVQKFQMGNLSLWKLGRDDPPVSKQHQVINSTFNILDSFRAYHTLHHLPAGPLTEQLSLQKQRMRDCSRIMLFDASQTAPNGMCSQLNGYLEAVLAAVSTLRPMVVVNLKNQSFFGCERLKPGQKQGELFSLPGGISQLVRTPEWLTGNCPSVQPCANMTRKQFLRYGIEIFRNGRNPEFQCPQWADPTKTMDVLFLGGYINWRSYWRETGKRLLMSPDGASVRDWGSRLGASLEEISWLEENRIAIPAARESDTKHHQYVHQILGLLLRSGLLEFQPWIVRDVAELLEKWWSNDVGRQAIRSGDFVGVHVRRGDKVAEKGQKGQKGEAVTWVNEYWRARGFSREDRPKNFIPFEEYLKQLLLKEDGQNSLPLDVYVATDDPETLQQEIAELQEEHRLYNHTKDLQLKLPPFRFHFSPQTVDAITVGRNNKDCGNRYQHAISMVADLLLLTRSKVFLGDFNSNVGRMVNTHRVAFKENKGVGTAFVRDVRLVFGHGLANKPPWPR